MMLGRNLALRLLCFSLCWITVGCIHGIAWDDDVQEDGPYASAQGPAYGTSTRRVSESPVVQLCYSILGLEPGATENAIKSAYRRRALKFHSDKIALEDGKDVVMTGLNTAKRILLDEPGQDHSSDLKALQEALVAMRELGGVR